MKIFGSISRLVSILFRKDGQDVTFRPNQSTTYTAARDIQLPVGDQDHELVGTSSSQTLSNKTLDGDSNTIYNVPAAGIKPSLSDADKLLLRDVSGMVVSAKLENKHVAADAAIAFSKLAALTASKVLVSDAQGVVSASSITATELGYLSGLAGNVQSQLSALSASSSGALADAIADIEASIAALTTDDVEEGSSNLYFTAARAKAAAVVDSGYTGAETDVAPSVRAVVAAIQDLQDAIDAEQAARESDDDALAADIASEAATRAASDASLQTAIDNEVTARQSAVSSEASTRAAADQSLQAEIDAEESARAAADSALQSAIDAEVSARQSAVSSEASARQSADATLQSNLDAVEAAMEAADAALDARLDVLEGSAATVGSVAKAEADAKAYADQKIADLIDGAPALLDTLNEIAAAIGDDANYFTTVANSISSEASARQAADASLQSSMDALESALEAADASLQANIDAEASARQAADAQHDSDIATKLNKPTSGDAAGHYVRSNGDGSTYFDVGYILPVFKANWAAAAGTSKTVTHNMGSTDVAVSIYDLSDNSQIGVDAVVITDGNTVTLTSSEAPSVSGWRVIVQKL